MKGSSTMRGVPVPSRLNMLIMTAGGFDFTAADCIAWMQEVGFRCVILGNGGFAVRTPSPRRSLGRLRHSRGYERIICRTANLPTHVHDAKDAASGIEPTSDHRPTKRKAPQLDRRGRIAAGRRTA